MEGATDGKTEESEGSADDDEGSRPPTGDAEAVEGEKLDHGVVTVGFSAEQSRDQGNHSRGAGQHNEATVSAPLPREIAMQRACSRPLLRCVPLCSLTALLLLIEDGSAG